MPRSARMESPASIYHVVHRGVGQQIIFEDDEDREFFLSLLVRFSPKVYEGYGSDYLFAWCLMSNHFHLLIRLPLDTLTNVMKLIDVTYARYFNDRHGRSGHLFQDRFKSEPIDSEGYLLEVLRYIHHNPQKAGLASFRSYPWSSFHEYLNASKYNLANTTFILGLFSEIRSFIDFHSYVDNPDTCLDVGDTLAPRKALSDKEALSLAAALLGKEGIYQLKNKQRAERDEAIFSLKEAGVSIRQLARISGIGKNIIERAQPERV